MQTPIDILRTYFGYEEFRIPQQEIIQSVLEGKDTLALLPTGGGKSICFQIPALAKDGICVVISPLIALMKDQVFQLKKRNIKAAAIFSGLSYNEIDIILDNCVFDYYKILYVSPERLKTELFIERFKKMKVNLIAVDEAHCISQWGYDFRPPYLEIAEIRKHHPKVPVLALTASATPKVQQDIIEKLALNKSVTFTKTFERQNLSFIARKEEAKYPKTIDIIEKIKGCGIIYVRSRNKTKSVSDYLNKNKISADFYHAGLSHQERNLKQENWLKNKTQVIVCTNAFGMGIDKADVRYVIHLDIPESLEAYYQEAGRAGRDGKQAYATLLYTQSEIDTLKDKLNQKFPPLEDIKSVYNSICNYFGIAVGSGNMRTYPFDINEFCSQFNMDAKLIFNALKILEQENYMQLSDGIYMPSRIVFRVQNLDIYKFQVANSKYDLIIKTLLRNYGGIIEHYTKINEKQLSNQLNCTVEELKNQLLFLQKNKIITYISTNEKPTITLLNERLHENNLRIDSKHLKLRKTTLEEQLDAILHYVEQQEICRQAIFCSYFGETQKIVCNKCDICLEKKRNLDSNENFKIARDEILKKTNGNWMKMQEIIPKNAHFTAQLYKEVIRFLLDEKLLEINNKNELRSE